MMWNVGLGIQVRLFVPNAGAMLTPRGAELVERFCKIQCGINDKFASELAFAAHLAGGGGRKIPPRVTRWLKARAELL
ncbi:hypothetical protein [Nitrobacter sp.]|uniref:hypothetical protein n=1 Tax=Nitrobacter sp. TaxID=29420 RepID=UPI00399D59F6